MGRQVGTLDRNDRYYLALTGERGWANEMFGFLAPDDLASSYLALDIADRPAGFVLLGAFDEPATASIFHIGVLPEQRGHGYIDDLLVRANLAARERGFESILSDVDVENAPMRAAMVRARHLEGRRPWHVWHYRRTEVDQ